MSSQSYVDLWNEIENSDWMKSFFSRLQKNLNNKKVLNYRSALDLNLSDFQLGQEPQDLNFILNELQKYMDHAVNTQSPYFVNQLYGGAHPISILSEWVTAFMNTSMATYEIAPLATFYEREIVKSLGQLMSWPSTDGLMVPGGSYANMLSLHLSRFKKDSSVKTSGHNQKFIIYISDQAHYSVKKAAHLLGYGENQVRVISSDSLFKMDTQALKSSILKDINDGAIPTCVVSTLGTTVFGAIDPINEIQKICSEFQIWHHVDGAWGGPLVFSDSKVSRALSAVDSVTFDFHKLLGGTLTKALFVTQHLGLLSEANSCAGTQYIFHEDQDSFFDTGTKAIQCGRKVDAVSLWMTWKYLGHNGYKSYVEKLMNLRAVALNQISKYGFELLHQPEYLNICFRIPISKNSKFENNRTTCSQFQKLVRSELIKNGHVMVNYSSTENEGVFIRLVLSHLRLDEEVIKDIFKIIFETSEKVKNCLLASEIHPQV
jgi:glutamate/tyrosine decarboxylase-like PLP-dependent enzyme